MTPAQQTFAPSSLLQYTAPGEIGAGDAAYMRVRVAGFVKEDKAYLAIVEPIERGGQPCSCDGRRQVYFVPVNHLVPAKTIAKEMV